jgi:hypothetical protein
LTLLTDASATPVTYENKIYVLPYDLTLFDKLYDENVSRQVSYKVQ